MLSTARLRGGSGEGPGQRRRTVRGKPPRLAHQSGTLPLSGRASVLASPNRSRFIGLDPAVQHGNGLGDSQRGRLQAPWFAGAERPPRLAVGVVRVTGRPAKPADCPPGRRDSTTARSQPSGPSFGPPALRGLYALRPVGAGPGARLRARPPNRPPRRQRGCWL
jgi:hypothetical protein